MRTWTWATRTNIAAPGWCCRILISIRSRATSCTAISRQAGLRRELGFDGICVNEHHQNAYGLMPSPNLMARALTRRTKRCKIAVIGSACCRVTIRCALAEEFAMLDVMSGPARRRTGDRRRSPNITPRWAPIRHIRTSASTRRTTCREGVDAARPVRFEGKHYYFRYVNPWPRPLQQPHPPIWCPSLG